jgi:c-di-GMP-binding flagellar brake protein YcgR
MVFNSEKMSRIFQFYVLFLVGATSSVHSAQSADFFSSIKYTFSKGADPEVVLGIALVALVLIGVLVLNEIRKADGREKARAKISWDVFYAKAASYKLTPVEIKVLESMVVESRITNADSILSSAHVFENARDEVYRNAGGVNQFSEHDLQAFRELRSRLGFSPLPVETPFVSSRQFAPGLRVIVEVPEAGVASATMIRNVDEKTWSTENPFEGNLGVHAGQPAKLSMTRGGDAEYTIDTEILQVKDLFISFKHTRHLSRRQLRNWVRVDVSIPGVVSVKDAESGLLSPPIKGRIADLSGGGMAMRLPSALPVGSRMLMDFQLNETPIIGMEVEVIRVVPLKNAEELIHVHSLSFKDVQRPVQERIVRFVFEKQRQEAQLH